MVFARMRPGPVKGLRGKGYMETWKHTVMTKLPRKLPTPKPPRSNMMMEKCWNLKPVAAIPTRKAARVRNLEIYFMAQRDGLNSTAIPGMRLKEGKKNLLQVLKKREIKEEIIGPTFWKPCDREIPGI